jgi:hypothetical protein
MDYFGTRGIHLPQLQEGSSPGPAGPVQFYLKLVFETASAAQAKGMSWGTSCSLLILAFKPMGMALGSCPADVLRTAWDRSGDPSSHELCFC